MSILIGKYEFDGPYDSVADLEDKPGIYAVLRCKNDEYELIHVAEAPNVKECIELSKSADQSCPGTVMLAACYTERYGPRQRRTMVEDIQSVFGSEPSPERNTDFRQDQDQQSVSM